MELTNGYFSLNGRPFFLYSGEVHYFRIPKTQWRARLTALKKAGFNTVSTYIPWSWHEPEEGRIDLTGETHPERDVMTFLDTAKSLGLFVSARVGPVSNAELVNEGIPGWLLSGYPDVFVTGRRNVGNLPHVTILSYLHPVFQEKVSRWYDALLPGVVQRQTTRGGNVLAVQLCNEVAMVHWLQKGADHKDHVNRMYRRFIQETHGSIQALNDAYKTAYASFDEVHQPKSEDADADRVVIHVDWSLFYRRYYATYFHLLARRARDLGVDVPLFCNIPQFYDYDIRGRGNWAPMTTSMFRDFPILTPKLIFGGAYQMRHLDFENFHDVALTTEVTRMLGAVAVNGEAEKVNPALEGRLPALPPFEPLAESPLPVVCAELQTGIMRDRPRLYPQQVALNVKSSVGQGLSGLNAYMFAGGVNPPGYGAFGTYHDWQAPIGPKGEARPHLEPLKEFGRFIAWAGSFLAQTKKVVDTTFGFYLPYYGTEYWAGPWVDGLEGQRTNLWYDGVARLVQLAGYSYDYTDVQRSTLDVLRRHKSLWVYSLDFMDHDTQAKLAAYVREGGKLILGPRLPVKDLRGEADTTLADALGLSVTGEQKGNLFKENGTDQWVQGPIQTYATEAKARTRAELPSGAGAVHTRVGRGEAVVVGFGLPHVFDHFREWVGDWAKGLGLVPKVICSPWDIQAVLRCNEEFGFLFVFNYHFVERKAAVSLPRPGGKGLWRLPATGTMTLAPLSGAILPLNIPLDRNVRLVYATAEVLSALARGRKVKLVFATLPGGQYEVRVALPAKPRVAISGGKSAAAWSAGEARLDFEAEGAETEIQLTW
jgi:beta-galactosidase